MAEKKKVLVVDDDEINRKILHKILDSQYKVIEAEEGGVALNILSKEKEYISAVLLDLKMPGVDGFDMLKIMRQDPIMSQIPIIVTTGSEDSETENLALSLGANDFIKKPYKPSIIMHRLSNTISLRESAALINSVRKDELTGLLKKEFFFDQVEKKLLSGPSKKYDIVCCDIERFKLVNDLYGTKVGDELLKYASNILKSIDSMEIVGRIGGDQFAALVKHREHQDNSIFDNLNKRINQFSISIKLNISYGIYFVNDITVPVSTMCDRALLAASSIRGKYDSCFAIYDDKMRQKLLSEQTITDNMKAGLKEGQFQVYYQPKFDIFTEKIAGAEALVRWNHPQNGFMSPGMFIPLFEKNGFIAELDFYVWDKVCAALKEWEEKALPLVPVSVNVSRVEIYNPNLPKILYDLTQKYGINPKYLHLEITETSYTENADQLVEKVKELKNLGFVIEMDEFGSGYSSLNMLSQMPLDVVKLDMKFIQNETINGGGKNILGFVISLAKWLNLAVVAEGVETQQQIDILRNMDCNYVQGFYYAKPMPKSDFEEFSKKVGIEKFTLPTEKVVYEKIQSNSNNNEHEMLIVDDNEINRNILAGIFSNQFKIIQSDNGKNAYQYVTSNYKNIDIILLDLIMPVMDGFQFLSKLKNNPKLMNIPVIVTSQSGENRETRAFELGASDFIGKPYNAQVARHRVDNVLSEGRLLAIEKENALAKELEKMRYFAEHDSLTGLYNRTALETRLNSFFSINKKTDGYFVMIDIDNFKTINDVFGHDKGDKALQDIANIINCYFSKKDIVSRFGGDEFAVFVLQKSSRKDIDKKISLLCKKIQLQYGGIDITTTIGVSISPYQGNDYQMLYKKADTALLAAKRSGKNQYRIFDNDIEMPSPILSRNLDWLLDETSDGIMVCDAVTYDLLYLNHAACEFCGADRKKCTGKKCYEVLWHCDKPCSHCVPIQHMTDSYCEHEYVDGEKHYIIKGKLTEWGGKSARIQYLHDNTSKAIADKKLEDISNDRKQLLDLMPGGVFRYSADNDNDTFDFISENMLKMLGYERGEFVKKFDNRFSNMVYVEDRERVLNEIAEQIKTGNSDDCEYRIEKGDGTLCWVHDVGQLVSYDSGEKMFYVTIVDITKEHDAK